MTPDDRAPEPPAGPTPAPVPEPPAAGASAPDARVTEATGDATPAVPRDAATWGTTSSPVYGAGAQDTQPIASGMGDTRPIATGVDGTPAAWAAPTPPALVPGAPTYGAPPAYSGTPAPTAPTPDPWAVRQDTTTGAAPGGTSPYATAGVPAAAPPPPPSTPPGGPYGAPAHGAPAYGTPPGAPPYGGQPPYGGGPAGPPPYGSGPYGAPGPVPYGAPGAPGQPYPWTPPAPTDGMAVASLVTSVGGLVLLSGLPGPLGIGLGIGALRRIRRSGARGRGMAIAGIVVGAVGTVLAALLVVVVVALFQFGSDVRNEPTGTFGGQDELSEELDRLLDDLDSSGSADDLLDGLNEGLADDQDLDTLPSYTLPQDVAVGTCWTVLPEYYDLSDAVTVPCSQEHEAEVVAHLTATGAPATDLTTEDPVLTDAYAQCDAAVEVIDPGLVVWGLTDVWLPHPDQVATGQLLGYCVYEDTFGSTGSVVAPSGVSS